jgi:hypothetical protein
MTAEEAFEIVKVTKPLYGGVPVLSIDEIMFNSDEEYEEYLRQEAEIASQEYMLTFNGAYDETDDVYAFAGFPHIAGEKPDMNFMFPYCVNKQTGIVGTPDAPRKYDESKWPFRLECGPVTVKQPGSA